VEADEENLNLKDCEEEQEKTSDKLNLIRGVAVFVEIFMLLFMSFFESLKLIK